MHIRGVTLGLMALVISAGSGWAQSCPTAPSGSSSGWNVLLYNSKAKTGGLIPDAPYGSTQLKSFPVAYGSIQGVANAASLPKLVFKGNMLVCEPGRYEFSLVIEAGRNRAPRSLLCKGFLQSGTTKVVGVEQPGHTAMIGAGLQQAFTGAMELEKGSTDLELSLSCGSQAFGGRTSLMKEHPDEMLTGSAISLRVRGPHDNAPREFKEGEVYNSPRS